MDDEVRLKMLGGNLIHAAAGTMITSNAEPTTSVPAVRCVAEHEDKRRRAGLDVGGDGSGRGEHVIWKLERNLVHMSSAWRPRYRTRCACRDSIAATMRSVSKASRTWSSGSDMESADVGG